MIYDHNVICGGIFYRAGRDVPAPSTVAKAEEKPAKVETSTKLYTKSEVLQMNNKALKELAKSEGIENAETLKGTELKGLLIKKLGL